MTLWGYQSITTVGFNIEEVLFRWIALTILMAIAQSLVRVISFDVCLFYIFGCIALRILSRTCNYVYS